MDKRLDKLEETIISLWYALAAARTIRREMISRIQCLEKNLVDAAALEAATQAAMADGPASELGGFNVEDIEDGGNSKEYMRGYRAAAECYNKQRHELAELKAVINNRDDTIKELDRNNIKLVSKRDALLQSIETLKFECGGDK